MLYQNMLTGYLYEVPEQRFAANRMVYDGLGNPVGFLAYRRHPYQNSPTLLSAGYEGINGLNAEESAQESMPPEQEASPQGASTPAARPGRGRGAGFLPPLYCLCRPRRRVRRQGGRRRAGQG